MSLVYMLIALLLYFKVPKELLYVRKQFIFLYIFMPFLESSSLSFYIYTYKKINVNNFFFFFLKIDFLEIQICSTFCKKNWNYVKKILKPKYLKSEKKIWTWFWIQHEKLCCAVDHPTTLLYTYQTFLFVFFCTYVCVNLTKC